MTTHMNAANMMNNANNANSPTLKPKHQDHMEPWMQPTGKPMQRKMSPQLNVSFDSGHDGDTSTVAPMSSTNTTLTASTAVTPSVWHSQSLTGVNFPSTRQGQFADSFWETQLGRRKGPGFRGGCSWTVLLGGRLFVG